MALLPQGSFAAEQDEPLSPVWQKLDPAWAGISGKVIDFVGEDKQKLLADLAYAAVAADICQGLTLDRTQFQKSFDDGFGDQTGPARPAAETAQYGQQVSMYFGTYVGLLTAVGLLERDNFCEAAREMQTKGEGRFWASTK